MQCSDAGTRSRDVELLWGSSFTSLPTFQPNITSQIDSCFMTEGSQIRVTDPDRWPIAINVYDVYISPAEPEDGQSWHVAAAPRFMYLLRAQDSPLNFWRKRGGEKSPKTKKTSFEQSPDYCSLFPRFQNEIIPKDTLEGIISTSPLSILLTNAS